MNRTIGFIFVVFILSVSVTQAKKHHFSQKQKSKHAGRGLIEHEESVAARYLEDLEERNTEECNKASLASWNYSTNVSKENEDKNNEVQNAYLEFLSTIQKEILNKFPNHAQFKDAMLRREFKNLAISGPADMPKEDFEAMNALSSAMETTYSSATVCEYKNPQNCTLHLDPDLVEILASSRDYDELEYYWTAWHDKLGTNVKPSDYARFTAYQNQMAEANKFNNMAELWADSYDDNSKGFDSTKFMRDMQYIWSDLKPYYSKLHAYVRMKLRPIYGKHIGKDGYLPANIMGNMWSQEWASLDAITKPYPNAPSLDIKPAMQLAKFTPIRMFEEADKFFTGMGLLPMTDTFWKKSMFTKPTDGRDVVCHATANDFCTGKLNGDYRIKMCAVVNSENLETVHHEMGHIQYYMQYKDAHLTFRTGANPGFHEAIGDALALAVTTPKHIECVLGLKMNLGINCAENHSSTKKNSQRPVIVTDTDINYLFRTALDKFAFFPFALLVDTWRFEVFKGTLQESEYNDRWWELKKEFQGIIPPKTRPSTNFDPAAKYHIVANVEYVRYFISHILQYQFYEAMCTAAGEYNPDNPIKPLHQCDFTGSKEAGKILGNMLKLGFSKPWPDALEAMTSKRTLDIKPMMNYFKPVFDVIDSALKAANEKPCYGPKCKIPNEIQKSHTYFKLPRHPKKHSSSSY